MKILITGGAGFVGSHLCDKFVKQGHTVDCFDNFTNATSSNIQHLIKNRSFITINGDIRNVEQVERAVSDVDAIVHLAAQVRIDISMADPRSTYEINTGGTMNILEAARILDVEKVLFASSSEVYGSAQYVPIDESHPLESGNPYGASKIAGDRLCHAYATSYGMDIGILRPFNIYGPRQMGGGVIPIFVGRVLNNKPPVIHGDGSQSRDYIYIDDVVSAYDCMLHSRKPGAVNFGTGCDATVKVLAETVLRLCKSEIGVEYRDAPHNTTTRLVADIKKAKVLGWAPEFTLEKGLARFVAWYTGVM